MDWVGRSPLGVSGGVMIGRINASLHRGRGPAAAGCVCGGGSLQDQPLPQAWESSSPRRTQRLWSLEYPTRAHFSLGPSFVGIDGGKTALWGFGFPVQAPPSLSVTTWPLPWGPQFPLQASSVLLPLLGQMPWDRTGEGVRCGKNTC